MNYFVLNVQLFLHSSLWAWAQPICYVFLQMNDRTQFMFRLRLGLSLLVAEHGFTWTIDRWLAGTTSESDYTGGDLSAYNARGEKTSSLMANLNFQQCKMNFYPSYLI